MFLFQLYASSFASVNLHDRVARLYLVSFLPGADINDIAGLDKLTVRNLNAKTIANIFRAAWEKLKKPKNATLIQLQTAIETELGMPYDALEDRPENATNFLTAVDLHLKDVDLTVQLKKGKRKSAAKHSPEENEIEIVDEDVEMLADDSTILHELIQQYAVNSESFDIPTLVKLVIEFTKRTGSTAEAVLDFCREFCPGILEPKTGGSGKATKTSAHLEESIRGFISQCTSALESLSSDTKASNGNENIIAHSLYSNFGSTVPALTNDELRSLINSTKKGKGAKISPIRNLNALFAPTLVQIDFIGNSSPTRVEEIVQQIAEVPFLKNIEDAISWKTVCPFGNLSAFLDTFRDWLEVSLQQRKASVVELRHGEYILVPLDRNLEDLASAVRVLDADKTEEALFSLVLRGDGPSGLPTSSIRKIMAENLEQYANDPRKYNEFLRYLVCLLERLPILFAVEIFKSAVQPCLSGFRKSYIDDLINVASSSRVLKTLGQYLNITELKAIKSKSTENTTLSTEVMSTQNGGSSKSSISLAVLQQVEASKPVQQVVGHSSPGDCRGIVEQIRQQEFGIGLVLDEESRRVMEAQYQRNCRALNRLSKELCKLATHFTRKLIL